MPLYEFECDKCAKKKEVICKFEEISKSTPSCCDAPMRKCINRGVSAIFVGSWPGKDLKGK